MRFWWMAAVLIAAGGLYLSFAEANDWRKSASLIRRGVPVTATVVRVNGDPIPGHNEPGDSAVVLDFDWQGQHRQVQGFLEGRDPDQFIPVRSQVPIIIDPQDPSRWTNRQAPVPLAGQLAASAGVLLAAVVLLGVSALLRRRVLETWRSGPAAEAVVLGRSQTALAPRSWALRCALVEGEDKRVFTVYVPPEAPAEPGQAVWVIFPALPAVAPAASARRALAAAWFE